MTQKIKAEITIPQWLKELEKASRYVETPPNGFYNRKTLKKMLHCGDTKLKRVLSTGNKAGTLCRIMVKQECSGGIFKRIPFYGPKEKCKC